jgi:hypothetical protein
MLFLMILRSGLIIKSKKAKLRKDAAMGFLKNIHGPPIIKDCRKDVSNIGPRIIASNRGAP